MYAYKFRVAYDEVTDFVRDIEIHCTDNFESLHKILLQAIGLKGNELASFYICDSKWNKQNEITLIEMGEDGEEDEEEIETPDYDEDDNLAFSSKLPKFVMKESSIKDFIEDPHQGILYEYDFINPKFFFIELIKTFRTDPEIEYPRCTHKAKELPEEIINDPHNTDLDLDDFDLSDDDFDEFDDLFDDDDLSGLGSTDDFSDYR